jgi:hypothetical protein
VNAVIGFIKMIIQFDLTPQERYLVYLALTVAEDRLKDEAGYKELMQRVSALPCGAPGCSYCDPEDDPEDYDVR